MVSFKLKQFIIVVYVALIFAKSVLSVLIHYGHQKMNKIKSKLTQLKKNNDNINLENINSEIDEKINLIYINPFIEENFDRHLFICYVI